MRFSFAYLSLSSGAKDGDVLAVFLDEGAEAVARLGHFLLHVVTMIIHES